MIRIILIFLCAAVLFKFTNVGEVLYTGMTKATEYVQQHGVKGAVDSLWCGQNGCKQEGQKQ